MVVFVDHERNAFGGLSYPTAGLHHSSLPLDVPPLKYAPVSTKPLSSFSLDLQSVKGHGNGKQEQEQPAQDDDGRGNPNINGFSAILSCYPVVKQIARSVDLNTLDSLSMACRQFRANLLPFRSQLVRETLRCHNEPLDVPDSSGEDSSNLVEVHNAKLIAGKVGRCARDKVAECQRCENVICRNCTVKQPGKGMLMSRFRRLCTTCLEAPLSAHLPPYLPAYYDQNVHASTEPAFDHGACSCEKSVWLCRPCGQALRSDDTTYLRIWTWRSRYSNYLGGGLGTGIGDGCQGVKCGRGEYCLAAEEKEVEIDCEVDDWTPEHPYQCHGHHSPPHIEVDDGHSDEEPGYLRQEIVGVGGTVKQKVKKRVSVGACVFEHDDEREGNSYMARESSGLVRSWCGWCSRVIPSASERAQLMASEQA